MSLVGENTVSQPEAKPEPQEQPQVETQETVVDSNNEKEVITEETVETSEKKTTDFLSGKDPVVKDPEPSEEEQPQTEDSSQDEGQSINEREIAEKVLPELLKEKGFSQKSLDDVLKSYKEMQSMSTKISQELKELKEAIVSKNDAETVKETQEAETKIADVVSKLTEVFDEETAKVLSDEFKGIIQKELQNVKPTVDISEEDRKILDEIKEQKTLQKKNEYRFKIADMAFKESELSYENEKEVRQYLNSDKGKVFKPIFESKYESDEGYVSAVKEVIQTVSNILKGNNLETEVAKRLKSELEKVTTEKQIVKPLNRKQVAKPKTNEESPAQQWMTGKI